MTKNAGWMFLGNTLSYAVQAVYFVFAARLLGVVQFGVYAGATALVSIASQFSTFGSGFLFLRYVSVDHKRFPVYWGNILFSTASIGGGLVLLIHLFGGKIAGNETAPLLIYVGVGDCICGQLTQCCAQVFQTYGKMKLTASLMLVMNLLRCAVILCLYYSLHVVTASTWAAVQMCISLVVGIIGVYMVSSRFGFPEWHPGLFREHLLEASTFAISGATTSSFNDIDKTMLSHYGMNVANGIYSMAYRVINIATLPIRSIQAAAFPRFCVIGANGVRETMRYAWKVVRHTSVIGIAIAICLWLMAPLLPHLAGSSFSASVGAVRWLCVLPLFRAFHLSAGDAMAGAGFQSRRLHVQLFAAIANFACNLWLIPRYGWLGAAWTSIATDGALGAMNWGMLLFLVHNSARRYYPDSAALVREASLRPASSNTSE